MTPIDVIWLQTLGGTWEPVGGETAQGITVEDVSCSVDASGPRDLSATLRRDATVPWLDLTAFTPLEYQPDGLLVWSGRIRDTPTDQQLAGDLITINAVGWQYHLDDAKLNRTYVVNRLDDWRDQRQMLTAVLAQYHSGGEVDASGGAIALRYPNGVVTPVDGKVGVTLDLGPENTAKKIVVEWEHSNNATNVGWAAVAHPLESEAAGGGSVAITGGLSGGATGITLGTFSTAYRYVTIYITVPLGGALGADVFFRVKQALVFTESAYETSNASVLKPYQVVLDVKSRALPLLAATLERVTQDAASFSIPEFANRGGVTPRESIEAVNAFLNYRVGVDEQKRLVFGAKPAAAEVETFGEFDDASANSGDNLFDSVRLDATGADGSPVVVTRFASGLPGAIFDLQTVDQVSNPGFETNTTGWTANSGTLTRDTGVADNSVASGLMATTAGGAANSTIALPTGLVIGQSYRMSVRLRRNAAMGSGVVFVNVTRTPGAGFAAGLDGSTGGQTFGTISTSAFTTFQFAFTYQLAQQYLEVQVSGGGASVNAIYVDNVQIFRSASTIINRRGFARTAVLPVQSALPAVALAVIGDLFLTEHIFTPMKGTARVLPGDAKTILGGRDVSPAEMLLRWGEKLRMARAVDPDSGNSHREGRIAAVTYRSSEDVAEVSIDNEQRQIEAFLNRLYVATGGR